MNVSIPRAGRAMRHVIGVGVTVITALSLSPGATTASADSMLTPLVNTTCSYEQVVAALQADGSNLATLLNKYPQAQTKLQNFLALPVDQREQRAQQAGTNSRFQSMLGPQAVQDMTQATNTCHSY